MSNTQPTIEEVIALKREITLLKKVIAVSPCHVYWKNRQGIILGCNENNAAFLKLKSPDDIIGKTIYDYQTPEAAKVVSETDEAIMSSNTPFESMEIAFDDLGQAHYFFSNKVPIQDDDGNITGLVGISVDVTKEREREQALLEAKEKAEAANLAKSEFLSNMSHELRTPLNGILGMAQILNYSNLSVEDKRCVTDLIGASETLLSLINDVLNFSKLEAGKLEFQKRPFDLKKLLAELVHNASYLIGDKQIAATLEYPDDLPHMLLGDPLRIKQIFTNLIGNAVKFTTAGHIVVDVSCLEQTPDNAVMLVSVEDSGIGIPAENLEYIFERFHQINPAYMTQHTGTGLGLSIVKKLVEGMEGQISVCSALGQGSTFSVQLPFKKTLNVSPENHYPTLDPISADRATKKELRVLLVEDNLLNQRVAIEFLNQHFNTLVVVADTGQMALKKFHDELDVVLLDIGLPDMPGFDVAKAMNERMSTEGFSVPIIAMTAHIDGTFPPHFFEEAGIVSTLTKPVRGDDLRAIIEQHVFAQTS